MDSFLTVSTTDKIVTRRITSYELSWGAKDALRTSRLVRHWVSREQCYLKRFQTWEGTHVCIHRGISYRNHYLENTQITSSLKQDLAQNVTQSSATMSSRLWLLHPSAPCVLQNVHDDGCILLAEGM